MPTITIMYDVGQSVWFILPNTLEVMRGTIYAIETLTYITNTGTDIRTDYSIITEDETSAYVVNEEYVTLDSTSASNLLISLIDEMPC